MWIIIQVVICVGLILISIIMPKSVYNIIVGALIIFSLIEIFVPWLLGIQICNIIISGAIGYSIIEFRNNIFGYPSDEQTERNRIKKIARERYKEDRYN